MAHRRERADMKSATPATRQLVAAGVEFAVHTFDTAGSGEEGYGLAAAHALGIDPRQVFKTLIALVDDRPVVAVVPVSGQLSLRHLAALAGGKRAEMCPAPKAERLTGYVVGGISPFGQKQRLPVFADATIDDFDRVLVSGGRRGMDIEVAPAVLREVLGATVGDLGRER